MRATGRLRYRFSSFGPLDCSCGDLAAESEADLLRQIDERRRAFVDPKLAQLQVEAAIFKL